MEKRLENFLNSDNKCKIIGRDAHMNAGVIALFCEIDGEIFILFEKRAKSINQGGEISLPGGKREESDKNFLETAIRETFEEIGLKKERIKNARKYGTLILPIGIIVEVSVGYVENFSLDELNLNKDEVEKIILVPLKHFLTTKPVIEYVIVENQPYYKDETGKKINFDADRWGLPEKYKKPWRGNPRRLIIYPYDNEVIWGITGEIIFNIAKELQE